MALELRRTRLAMRIVGWSMFPLPLVMLAFPAGFLWGTHHGAGWHPYVFMLTALYWAWGILMVRGARDPVANKALLDWGILSSILHAAVMTVQALWLEHETAHLVADIPLLGGIAVVLWLVHPARVGRLDEGPARG